MSTNVTNINTGLSNVVKNQANLKAYDLSTTSATWETDLNNLYLSMPNNTNFVVYVRAGWVASVVGYKCDNLYGTMTLTKYGTPTTSVITKSLYGGSWTAWATIK